MEALKLEIEKSSDHTKGKKKSWESWSQKWEQIGFTMIPIYKVAIYFLVLPLPQRTDCIKYHTNKIYQTGYCVRKRFTHPFRGCSLLLLPKTPLEPSLPTDPATLLLTTSAATNISTDCTAAVPEKQMLQDQMWNDITTAKAQWSYRAVPMLGIVSIYKI